MARPEPSISRGRSYGRTGIAAWHGLVAASLLLAFGCNRPDPLDALQPVDHAACAFDVYWPVQDPELPLPPSARPLLKGTLTLDAQPAESDIVPIKVSITLTRPSEEIDREYWNSALAFSYIRWMDELRVWDADGRWLWPNLAYLLRLPGEERVDRYGGMDPGKHVDNDFAGLLLRKYDASGRTPSSDTEDAPLVSAEWRPADAAPADRHGIVHAARSDEFLLHVGKASEPRQGRVKVWLIYADFFGARTPATWPKAKEFSGGILAYFEIDWKIAPEGGLRCIIRQKRPTEGTHFDWAEWANRKLGVNCSKPTARLSDSP